MVESFDELARKIDATLLRRQREMLLRAEAELSSCISERDHSLLKGVNNLLDALADLLHDKYGKRVLLEESEEKQGFLRFELPDLNDEDDKIQVVVKQDPCGVSIGVAGHGMQEMDDSCCDVIYLERSMGECALLVWSDINDPDPTHRISLNDAKLERRN